MQAKMNVHGNVAGTYVDCEVLKEAPFSPCFLLTIQTNWPAGDKLEIRIDRAGLETLIKKTTVASWSNEEEL